MPVRDEQVTEVLPDGEAAEAFIGEGRARGAGAAPEALIGRTLGKLTLVEHLGRGGAGDVFRAEQPQLGRSAVIKVLRQEGGGSRVDRFLREAQLASRLDHPYAAHVYAFGAERDGVLWIAMEHVRGATLDQMVGERGPMPTPVFAPLFARLCEVVHTAHELGIVHRDIKGSNVMVIERAGQLLPKLLDFGIAKGLDSAAAAPDGGAAGAAGAANDAALTATGGMLGSPHYMAPEQWTAPADVDARADIYGLGVLAYRCVSGRLPFQGLGRAQLPEAHRAQVPPPLPASVPAPIAEAIARALAKEPAARWPTALAFGEAVRAAAHGAGAGEAVPLLDPAAREAWERRGPQPIADAVGRLARAATTVEADAALRELVAIACRWLAVLALAQLRGEAVPPEVREPARAVAGRDDGGPWLRLARAAAASLERGRVSPDDDERVDPAATARRAFAEALAAILAQAGALEALADGLDDRDRARTAAALSRDLAALPAALAPLAPLLAYRLVAGRGAHAESWVGPRRSGRERVVVWGAALPDGAVALLDLVGRVAAELSPLAQVRAPLPAAEPELFLLWRSGRGRARLVAAPWGFERDDDDAALRLASLTTEDTDTLADTDADRSPYPGLSPYGAGDAARFVGREREVEALANRLVRAPMLAVLGPSGAGKSSFIHAGVTPRLSEHSDVIALRPGRHPLHALHTALAAKVAARPEGEGAGAPRGLVIVVDQLEELTTLCEDPEERSRFAEMLARATEAPGAAVRVVATLRDDFASVLESEPALRGRFEVLVLATPPPEALRRIVTEPARRSQVTVEPRVVDEMVAEVAGRPASLPLLSFTASRLWEARDRAARRITHEAYAALGGVAGALSAYADQVYGDLTPRDQDAVRDLFSRLVAADGTRIPVPRAELLELPGAAGVLAQLIDARLLVVREESGGLAGAGSSTDVVEIVHECLAERWPRLARWRSEDAADRALYADVRAAARRWQDGARRPDLLWRGEALAELRRLAARSTALTEGERAFAAAAAAAERRARRLRRAAVAGAMAALAAAALVMAYLGLAANRSRAQAERSAETAREAAALAEERLTASLVAQGRRELNDGRALAALAYLGEAMRRGADGPGLRFLLSVGTRAWPHERLVVRGRSITAFAAAPGAIVAGDRQGALHFWTAAGAPLGEVAAEIGAISDLRERGGRLVAIGRTGIAAVDPVARRIALRVPMASAQLGAPGPGADEITIVSDRSIDVLGPDGARRRSHPFELGQTLTAPVFGARHLVFATGGTVRALDLVAMTERVLAEDLEIGPMASADGSTIAWLDRERTVHVRDSNGTPVATFKPASRAHFLALSADGARIGALGDAAVAVWTRAGRLERTLPLGPDELAVRLHGDEVWTGSANGVIRRYARDALVASLPSLAAEIADLRVGGELALAWAADGTLVGVRADARHLLLDPPPCEGGSYSMMGPAILSSCDGARTAVYVGRHRIGEVGTLDVRAVAFEPRSRRGAVVTTELAVFDAAGARIATSREHLGPVAFEDGAHLLVLARPDARPAGDTPPPDAAPDAAPDGPAVPVALWRLALATGAWQRIGDVAAGALSIAATAGGLLVGTDRGQILLYQEGREVHRFEAGDSVEDIATSADGRWAVAQLATGGTLVIDGRTGALERRLEPADAIGLSAIIDPAGDLVIRPHRGTLTVWDRATGETLLFGLDLLKTGGAAAFAADGRLELAGRSAGVLDLQRETRPTAEVLRDLACRVPLRVTGGGRLEVAEPVAGPECGGSR